MHACKRTSVGDGQRGGAGAVSIAPRLAARGRVARPQLQGVSQCHLYRSEHTRTNTPPQPHAPLVRAAVRRKGGMEVKFGTLLTADFNRGGVGGGGKWVTGMRRSRVPTSRATACPTLAIFTCALADAAKTAVAAKHRKTSGTRICKHRRRGWGMGTHSQPQTNLDAHPTQQREQRVAAALQHNTAAEFMRVTT